MTGESLFYSFALIDETYIKEAEKPSVSAHKSGTKVLAACFWFSSWEVFMQYYSTQTKFLLQLLHILCLKKEQ